MKICACVAEYNPFHLGHKKHIEYMRNELKAEYVVAVMSGNFTQRGEPAVLDKFTRAKHAVLSGADAVIELPTVFATANAENFAKGAVNLLADLCVPFGLCFGAESGDKQNYISLAEFLNEESKEFKAVLKQKLDKGVSFAKAKCETVKELGKDARLMSSPNNALGVEYTRAMLKRGLTDVYPMPREDNHNDATLKKGITSASSIREAIKSGGVKKVKKCVPDFVYKDLNSYPADYDKICLSHIILSSAEELERISDCTEGLNNRIKALCNSNRSIDELVERVATKRYTAARIRRILLANVLKIYEDLLSSCTQSPTYAKLLAVKKEKKEIIAYLTENSKIPVLTKKGDITELKKTAAKCFEKDVLANDLYNVITGRNDNAYMTLFV